MGSKNLKAVVFRGRKGINIAKLEEFLDACLETRDMFQQSPAFQAMISSGGRTSAVDELKHGMTAFGNFEESPIDDNKMIEDLEEKGKAFWSKYRSGRTGCIGCPVHHFHVFDFPGLGVGAPKCAAWGVFAAPLWNTDYELMYQAGFLCNQYGLDFVSTGNSIGFLMELYHRGIISERDTDNIPMRRGNKDAILSTIHKIARQEGFGSLFRNGLLDAARNIGKGAEDCAMHIKGREMPISGEPRSFKGMALAFAVCRDPLDAIPIPEFIWPESKEYAQKLAVDLCQEKEAADPGSYEKKGPLVSAMENRIIATEMVGFCKWFILNLTPLLEVPARLLSLATGKDINEKALLTAAERVRTLERAVNVTQGISRKDDRLPKRMLQTPVPRGPFKGASLDKDRFDMMIDDYYLVSGWDTSGVPQKETFTKLHMNREGEMFSQRMNKKEQANA
jgi:aldehyde:ferredoxin oxidoreductase